MEGIIAHAAVQQDVLEVLLHGAPIERLSEIVFLQVEKCLRTEPQALGVEGQAIPV